jgi:hypothetical protein
MAIAWWFRIDCEAIEEGIRKRLQSDHEMIAQWLQSDCNMIAKGSRIDQEVIVQRLISACKVIPKGLQDYFAVKRMAMTLRFRIDCEMIEEGIAMRLHSNFAVIAERSACDCMATAWQFRSDCEVLA